MKKSKKKILLIPLLILTLLMIYGLLFYFSFFQDYVMVNENNISSTNKVDDDFTSCYNPNINFSSISASPITDHVTIKILNNVLPSIKVYEKSLRYYIPLNSVCSTLNYTITDNNNTAVVTNNSNTIIFNDNNTCYTDGQVYNMRGGLIIENDEKYISISDIEYLFNLTAIFNFDSKEISFLNKLPDSNIVDAPSSQSGKAVLIRLEDFSAGYGTLDSENQLKYKCIGNFLKSNRIKFHIAWVPRFISPSQDIDNDLLKNNCLENVGFINTLDYLINSGAEIGLHGYTHQTGEDTSLNGVELSYNHNSSEEETRKVIENAINTAATLNIPCSFFESPHYKATSNQKKIIEEYFQFLYEPKNIFIYNKLQKHNKNLYIPTPLGYIKDLDTSAIEKFLRSPLPGQLASLFYHPALELQFIDVNIYNSDIDINYNTASPLYKIVKSINNNNYVSIYVTDLKKE